MPISSDSFQVLDDIVNRLATESILAQPGRDDGLVPAYSLLGDVRELCGPEAALYTPIAALHARLEGYLDAAKPFSDELLLDLRALVRWLPTAILELKADGEIPAFAFATDAEISTPSATESVDEARATAPTPAPSAPADKLLTLNLEENRELLLEFHGEALEHLQQIEAALLTLDQQPDNPEALNSIFRSFHTFKGNAGFLGLVPMQALAHEVESLLDLARNHELWLSGPIITAILQSRDALSTLTHQVGAALHQNRLPAEIVPVGHLVVAIKQFVATATPNQGGDTLADLTLPESEPVGKVAEITAAFAEMAANLAPVANLPTPVSANVPAAVTPKSTMATVRVNIEKLDSLMDVVGELVIVQGQLLETSRHIGGDPTSPLQRNVGQLNRITKELQHTAMALRMIPIKPTFQKMERLARDLAREFGKKIQFLTSGEETELDRTVVEEIGDPFVHMVRNALDHGLESPAERVAAGKSETGTLHLGAYHQGSTIIVELRDDGRGMDPERIFKKAVEKGLIKADAVMTKEEILNLIMAPGFSTAEKVTAISGRGVGMDVVKRNLEKLRGTIEISSELGRGSTLKIKLPLTMAIIDGLIVRVGTDRFILPSTSVQRALRPTRENISTVHGRGEVLDLRGRLVPIHRLHQRFGIPHDAEQPWDGIVVIVEHSGKISALLVDEMVSKQEVVIKNLGAFIQNIPGVAGGAILGDGTIALILDPTSLLRAA